MTLGAPIFHPAGPIAIRDATFDRVKAVSGLVNVYKARTIPGQDDQMPYAVVWYSGERTQPNGDANVGAPSFLHTLTLIVDVFARATDEGVLDAEIVTLVETIRATLMTDPTWVASVEGIERIDTRYAYPKEAADVAVQAIIEFEVTFRSEWPPYLPNDLKLIEVTVAKPPARWTCSICGTSNAGASCSTCSAPAPATPLFITEIELDAAPSC